MAFPWTPALEAEVIRLREVDELSWAEIADAIGADSQHVPRIRYSRRKNGTSLSGVSLLPEAEAPTDGLPNEVTYEVEARFATNEYEFDGATYYFPVNHQVVKVPKNVWERIIAAYSGEGANAVQAQIAQDIGMHKKVLEACLRKYGAYKASPPITREALAEARDADLAPLYDKAIEVREAEFIKGLRQRKLGRLEAENKKLLARVEAQDEGRRELRALIADLLVDFPRVRALHIPHPAEVTSRVAGTRVIAPVFDAHFGLKVQGGWGGTFTTETAAHYTTTYFAQVAAYLQENPTVSDVTVLIGGDLFHAFMQRTARGTPLERDRPDREVFRAAIAAFTSGLAALRARGVRLDLIVIPGNHDHLFVELFEETLAAYYREDMGVRVPNALGKRKYQLIGDSLHLFDHGEGFERLSHQQFAQAEMVARQVAGADFYRAKRIYLYVGHTHHLEMKAHGAHLEVIRFPNPAHTNDYEEGLMHAGEPQGAFVRLDAQGRVVSLERVYFTDFPHAATAKRAA